MLKVFFNLRVVIGLFAIGLGQSFPDSEASEPIVWLRHSGLNSVNCLPIFLLFGALLIGFLLLTSLLKVIV